jgi:Cu(I)/Ag(I) efflux system membrane fusion protein
MSRSRIFVLIILVCAAIAAAYLLMGRASRPAPEASTNTKTLYTCGMHPQVIQDKPGDCPICGMKLEPVRKQASSNEAASGERQIKFYRSTMNPGEVSPNPGKDSMGMDMEPVYESQSEASIISIDPITIQKMGVRTGVVTRGPLERTIRTVGMIDYNETALADVTTRFDGWLEKLYVDASGQHVKKGEPLFEIYSPDLYSAQNEYVLALAQNNPGLKASAKQKLKLYDISDDQLTDLERTRRPQRTLQISAPIDGIVIEKMAVQGQMAEAGMKLYRLADLSIVWVQSQIYEQDLGFVQLGQQAEVSLTYLPDRKFEGRVTYVYPTVDDKTRTAKVRMEFHNPGLFLKPGMFATVELKSQIEDSTLLVPDTAVLRSGETNTVFVALDGGRFEPRVVKLGLRSADDTYQVISGLNEGERVVTSAQFMLDSESQLREAIQKMVGLKSSDSPPVGAKQIPALSVRSESTSSPSPREEVSYFCPMQEHATIRYDHDGKCPICGMTLIPADATTAAPADAASPSPKAH